MPPEHVTRRNTNINPRESGVRLWKRTYFPSAPSSARALVAKVDDAGAEGTGLGQPQVEGFGKRREVRGAAAKDDRVDELAVFVDQVLGDGGCGEARPADGHHALTRLVTESADLGGDVAGGQPCVACHRIQRPGEHHLRDRSPDPGEL